MESSSRDLERIASSYDAEIIQGWERIYQLKWAYAYLKLSGFANRGSALELGCADGAMSRMLAADFDSVTIVDGSLEFLRSTEKKLGARNNVFFEHSLFEEFEPAARYDAIFMSHILEHLEDPVELLSRASRWLARGGVILATVPNAQSLHRRVGVKMGLLSRFDDLNEQDRKLGHRRVYDASLLRQHIKDAGLEVRRLGGIMLKPVSNRQMNDWDERLLKALFEMGEEFPELSSELYAVLAAPSPPA